MAEADWGSVQAPEHSTQAAQGTSIVSMAGALMSLALIAGLAVWGYKLAVRDVTGVPVVRALEGPMRVQPEDPGGQAAAHQGLSVNNVQADGQAGAPADRLALAPRPVELAPEDMPVASMAQVSVPLVVISPEAEAGDIAAATDEAVAVALSEDTSPADPAAAALALAEALTVGEEPLSDEVVDTEIAAVAAPVAPPAVATQPVRNAAIPASVPGVKVSARPVPRPAQLETTPAAAPVPTSADGAREVAAGSIPVGTRLVQLGAFESEAVARAEWTTLAQRFEDYMEEKSRVIEKASSGGKTFYRLRAMGFADLSDARRFCSVLMAGKAACIPVVTR